MTTNDPENKAKTTSRRPHTHLLLRILILFAGAVTAGTVLNITISPVITVGTQGAARESGAAISETGTNSAIDTMIPGNSSARTSSHLCGHMTKNQTPCKLWVKGPGYCWIHNRH